MNHSNEPKKSANKNEDQLKSQFLRQKNFTPWEKIHIRKACFIDLPVKPLRPLAHHWLPVLSISIIVVWASTGPIFKFSDTWQLVINTGTQL